jgi:malate dehydrogenase (oxaloacetate-decarboxylating)
LPPLGELRKLSFQVAIAVAKQAETEGLARPIPDQDLIAAVNSKMWEPAYAPYQRLPPVHGA